MKIIYYFLIWNWKRYKFKYIHLVPLSIMIGTVSIILKSLGYITIGKLLTWFIILVIIGCLLKILIIDPIFENFQEYKKERQELLDKINFGTKHYDKINKRT